MFDVFNVFKPSNIVYFPKKPVVPAAKVTKAGSAVGEAKK